MNMTITESDKKLLGFLAGILVVALFFLLVFRPLHTKQEQIEEELKAAKQQEADLGTKADLAEQISQKEVNTKEQMKQVLARFYPTLKSQDAERMVTTLMLNHNLDIQSLTVTMPEKSAELDWYQYSENAVYYGQPAETEEVQPALSLYVARVTCVVEGDGKDLWELVDDISLGYPAISIVSTEWSSTERVVTESVSVAETDTEAADAENEEDAEIEEKEAKQTQQAEPVTVKTDRLTIGLEIYMCNQ